MELDNASLELLNTLASMQGERVELTEEEIKLIADNCPGYGGTRYALSEQGLNEAIQQYTHNLLS